MIINNDAKYPFKILALGAHSDDIEIGCGGAVLRLLNEYDNLDVMWIAFSGSPERVLEGKNSANKFLAQAGKKEIRFENFRDGFFPYEGGRIKEYFETLKTQFSPDLIFTPYKEDFHQDHRLISELTWNTFRNHLILEYEIIKYDGDLGRPNFYIELDESTCQKKIDIILSSFRSQIDRAWFTADSFFSILRLRGIEINSSGRYAEAFYSRKILI
jgi:LmbE family N-acetylglucosaminyl deacetylase